MQRTTDFIIIGSGIAGLHAALVLADYGKVLIVTKASLYDSATNYAQGGIAAVMDKKDSVSLHIRDTLQAGSLHNNKDAVSFLVKNGAESIRQLLALSVPFDKETSFEGGHSYPRVFHASDFTGQAIQKALIRAIKVNRNIEVWEHTFAVDLLVVDNRCYGVYVVGANTIRPFAMFARATVLATGGVGQVYQWTTNPSVATGDGIAMAYRAGANLADMEFVQFHPTALKENSSPLFLLSEALRGEGGVLVDRNGKRFVDELAPRDVVSRAIFKKQKEGKVFLDMRNTGGQDVVFRRFPNIYNALLNRGFDLSTDLIPITPAAHFLCGGVVTDLCGRTSIKNLFAYGEVAATGVHGANRLASNSLLEGFVFSGQIKACINELPEAVKPFPTAPITNYQIASDIAIERQLKEIMWQCVGIERSSKTIAYAIKTLTELEGETRGSIITKNMLETALLISKAAYKRKESLGTHWITEY